MCTLGLDPDEPGIIREGTTVHPSYSHGSCRNAERYLVSLAADVDKRKKSGEPKAKDALDKLKATQGPKYREKIMELVISGKARRGATKQPSCSVDRGVHVLCEDVVWDNMQHVVPTFVRLVGPTCTWPSNNKFETTCLCH